TSYLRIFEHLRAGSAGRFTQRPLGQVEGAVQVNIAFRRLVSCPAKYLIVLALIGSTKIDTLLWGIDSGIAQMILIFKWTGQPPFSCGDLFKRKPFVLPEVIVVFRKVPASPFADVFRVVLSFGYRAIDPLRLQSETPAVRVQPDRFHRMWNRSLS